MKYHSVERAVLIAVAAAGVISGTLWIFQSPLPLLVKGLAAVVMAAVLQNALDLRLPKRTRASSSIGRKGA